MFDGVKEKDYRARSILDKVPQKFYEIKDVSALGRFLVIKVTIFLLAPINVKCEETKFYMWGVIVIMKL